MKILPRLVDHSLNKSLHKPLMKKAKLIINPINANNSNNLLVNIVAMLILFIGGLFLYDRLMNREGRELEKQNTIIGFHQYVKDNIK